ncbi:nuclease-related domain-containing protein [Nocardioides sp. W7]|uniref:nuclease-related domain-containing protein n=1 Tax=Nocardioides sp. W7 TaxID=2931390 RepID=UPI001FD10D27|nr:nuclease-related domain-containing protein [Nocardioides sp. W7]
MERYVLQGGTEEAWHALHASLRKAAEDAEEELPAVYAELRALIAKTNPIVLYGAIDVYDAMRRSNMPGPANFGSDAMVELLGGFVTSSDEVEMLNRISATFAPEHLQEADHLLRRIANLRFQAGRRGSFDSDGGPRSRVLNLLRLENDFDRMAGFDKHVRQIAAEVFSRVDERVVDTFGFRLTEALRFADLYSQVRVQHAQHADDYIDTSYPALPPDVTQARQQAWMIGQIVFWALTAAAPLEGTDFDDVLAENLDIDPSTFTKLVEALSTRIGSVSADDALNDNPVRTRPIIGLSSGEWMWPRPIDFIHAAVEWGYAVVQTNARLATAYDKARHHTTEDLTEEALRAVFGDRVHRAVRYPTAEADAEIDVLVALPGVVLVVECKGGRFSRAGRRGAPRRVDRHVQDIVDRANTQNARTESAIRDGLPFTDTDGHLIDLDPSATVLPMTVTLDRMDPFSAYLGFSEDGDRSQRSWIINLADLLLLAEVLPAPSDFAAYLVERRTMLADEVSVFVEADSLGAWCEDRLVSIRTLTNAHGTVVARMVSNTSDWMNDYFTTETITELQGEVEAHHYRRAHPKAAERPNTRVPPPVMAALDSMLARDDPNWLAATTSVLSVAPRSWNVLTRLLAAVEAAGGRPLGKGKAKQLRRAAGGLNIDNKVVIQVTLTAEGLPRLAIDIS